MRAYMDFSGEQLAKFKGTCEIMITKVGKNTRKATVAACEAILAESLKQVPRETNTLASSASYKVTGNYRVGWEGTVSYASDIDPINPVTGRAASEYVVAVHEDLNAWHLVGKAKFLEDPAREFAKENFPRTVFRHVQESLASI